MGGVQNGVWIENFSSTNPSLASGPTVRLEPEPDDETVRPAADPAMMKMMMERYGLASAGMFGGPTAAPAARDTVSTNEVVSLNVTCRAVSRRDLDATADDRLLFVLESQLQASPLFDPAETRLSSPVTRDDELTFSFGITLKLKNPIKL
jgi:hypothetical protein